MENTTNPTEDTQCVASKELTNVKNELGSLKAQYDAIVKIKDHLQSKVDAVTEIVKPELDNASMIEKLQENGYLVFNDRDEMMDDLEDDEKERIADEYVNDDNNYKFINRDIIISWIEYNC